MRQEEYNIGNLMVNLLIYHFVIIDILSVKLTIYSHQILWDSYLIIYMWIIVEQVLNLSPDIQFSDTINRRDKLYETKYTRPVHIG